MAQGYTVAEPPVVVCNQSSAPTLQPMVNIQPAPTPIVTSQEPSTIVSSSKPISKLTKAPPAAVRVNILLGSSIIVVKGLFDHVCGGCGAPLSALHNVLCGVDNRVSQLSQT